MYLCSLRPMYTQDSFMKGNLKVSSFGVLSLTSQPFPRLSGADDQENISVCRMRLENGLTEWEGTSGVFDLIKSKVPNRYRGFKSLVGPGPGSGSALNVCQFFCLITFSFLLLSAFREV